MKIYNDIAIFGKSDFQLQIGSNYYRRILNKKGVLLSMFRPRISSSSYIFNFTGDAYRRNALIFGIHTEANVEVALTRLNSRDCDLVTVMLNKKQNIYRIKQVKQD